MERRFLLKLGLILMITNCRLLESSSATAIIGKQENQKTPVAQQQRVIRKIETDKKDGIFLEGGRPIPFDAVWDAFKRPLQVFYAVQSIGPRKQGPIIEAFKQWVQKQPKEAITATEPTNSHFPLYLAAYNNNEVVVDILIKQGADIYQKDKGGITAFGVAINNGYREVVNCFIRKEVAVWNTFPAPLQVLEVVKRIHSNQSEPVITAFQQWIKKQSKKDLRIAEPEWGNFPLLVAVANDNKPLVQILLASSALIDQADKKGTTSLMLAARKGYITMVAYLLKKGAEVNAIDKNGWSALMMATSNKHKEIVSLLIKAGAWKNIVSRDETTALFLACEHQDYELVDILLKAGASPHYTKSNGASILLKAIFLGNQPIVEKLLQAGADINYIDTYGDTALTAVFANKNMAPEAREKMIKFLLEQGANVNQADDKGTTALIKAAFAGSKEGVRLLLEAGAEIDLLRKDTTEYVEIEQLGQKALDFALDNKNQDIIDLFAAQTFKKIRQFQVACLCEKALEERETKSDEESPRCCVCLGDFDSDLVPLCLHADLNSKEEIIKHETCVQCAKELIGKGFIFRCPLCKEFIKTDAVRKTIEWYEEAGDAIRKEVISHCLPEKSNENKEDPDSGFLTSDSMSQGSGVVI